MKKVLYNVAAGAMELAFIAFIGAMVLGVI